jgi:hypothetical protein
MKLLVRQISPFTRHLISSLLDPNILLSTLFSNILSLYSSLNVRDQVSHPYRTADKIIFLYILIYTFFDSRREDRRYWTEWSNYILAGKNVSSVKMLQKKGHEVAKMIETLCYNPKGRGFESP